MRKKYYKKRRSKKLEGKGRKRGGNYAVDDRFAVLFTREKIFKVERDALEEKGWMKAQRCQWKCGSFLSYQRSKSDIRKETKQNTTWLILFIRL